MMVVCEPTPKRFSAEEFYRLGELGMLGRRSELIRGQIIDLPPIGPGHAYNTTALDRLIRGQLAVGYHVRLGLPLDLGESQPQPDLAVIAGVDKDYKAAHPQTAALVVEVSDSSLTRDRREKASIYAEAGIPEYWIVDIVGRRIEVLTRPVSGFYADTSLHAMGETVVWHGIPEIVIAVSELF